MNPSIITGLVAATGLLANAAWTIYNARMETKVLAHIDGLKAWINENYRSAPLCLQMMHEVTERLNRAGA